jgi:hypothetical protein
MADHTYHDDISPRSSLPGIPWGESLHSSTIAWRTVCCVFHGSPAKS